MLSDYFAPLNFVNISYYLLLLTFFDIFGTFIKNFFDAKDDSSSRIINWMIGFSGFIFLWFIISFFASYNQTNIIVSISFIVAVTLPSYVIKKRYLSLINSLKSSILPILIILPFLPSVFIKAGLPPYYGDEMAYHYIAPSALMELDKITYTGGLYANLPRNLNLFWELVFSLTKTYSIARVFHFTILVSALIYSFQVLKKYFGLITGTLFILLFLSIPQDIVLTSTLGYIDVGAFSFLLIAVIFSLKFLAELQVKNLYLSAIFWGLTLGTKYTGLTNFISYLTVFIIILILNRKKYFQKLSIKNVFLMIILFTLTGGYWYIKNIIFYGNPVFPFLFSCWGTHVEPCPQSGGFFGDWTTKINFANANLIASQLIAKNIILRLFVFLTPIVTIILAFTKDLNKKLLPVFILIYLTFITEFIILKSFSGFYIRYHQHLQLYLILGLVIFITFEFKNKSINLLRKFALFILLLYSLYFYLYNISFTNSLRFLNWNEINYATGKINIYDWVKMNFPKMNEVILWCDGGEGRQTVELARFDPDLIWFDHNGLMRVFLIRCRYVNPNLETDDVSKIIPSAIRNKQKFWISSSNRCIDDKMVEAKYPYERDYQSYLRKVDNKIICNSDEILPNLYLFDYQKLIRL